MCLQQSDGDTKGMYDPITSCPQAPGMPAPTCGLENPRVAQAVSLSKGFHHPVNLLGLSREAEAPQKLPGLEWGQVWLPGLVEPFLHPQSLC